MWGGASMGGAIAGRGLYGRGQEVGVGYCGGCARAGGGAQGCGCALAVAGRGVAIVRAGFRALEKNAGAGLSGGRS